MHMDMNCQFLRDRVKLGQAVVEYKRVVENVADAFTEAMGGTTSILEELGTSCV